MGVNRLWNILEPVRKEKKLSELRNKTLCVDLSCWICEAQCANGLKQNVSKPHLRNLFFRLVHLTRVGVKLVFVVDGDPPKLKWEAIVKRIQSRNGETGKTDSRSASRVRRSHFANWVEECCCLLKHFGVPCIESTGEAEALCAWLDQQRIVDGCITNDGDAFLYGARTVYRDLSISKKDASVACYKMEEIESQLNLSRQNLVALGILLGCDYLPQGVSGVGEKKAMELVVNVAHENLIDRFTEWTKETCQDESLSRIERSVKRKALNNQDFPHAEVIQEFLAPKLAPQVVPNTACPDLEGLQAFCLDNLKWTAEKTRDKVRPFITYWQMKSSLQKELDTDTALVQPKRIVKTRVQEGVKCYDVEWQDVRLGQACPMPFVTTETRELFDQVYPDLVEEFNKAEEEKKLAKKSRKRNATETGLHGGKRRPEKTPMKHQKLITDMLKKTKNKCAEKSVFQLPRRNRQHRARPLLGKEGVELNTADNVYLEFWRRPHRWMGYRRWVELWATGNGLQTDSEDEDEDIGEVIPSPTQTNGSFRSQYE